MSKRASKTGKGATARNRSRARGGKVPAESPPPSFDDMSLDSLMRGGGPSQSHAETTPASSPSAASSVHMHHSHTLSAGVLPPSDLDAHLSSDVDMSFTSIGSLGGMDSLSGLGGFGGLGGAMGMGMGALAADPFVDLPSHMGMEMGMDMGGGGGGGQMGGGQQAHHQHQQQPHHHQQQQQHRPSPSPPPPPQPAHAVPHMPPPPPAPTAAQPVPPPKSKSKGGRKSNHKAKHTDAASASAAVSSSSAAAAPPPAVSSPIYSASSLPPFQLPQSTPLYHRYSKNVHLLPSASSEELKDLSLEVHRMSREAHHRFLRLETELRKIYTSRNGPPLESEGWFQQGWKMIQSLPQIDEPALMGELQTLAMTADDSGIVVVEEVAAAHGGKRKRNEAAATDAGLTSPTKPPSKNSNNRKKKGGAGSSNNSVGGGGGGGTSGVSTSTGKRGASANALAHINQQQSEWAYMDDYVEDDDEFDSDLDSTTTTHKPKKSRKMTEKEKARHIANWWSQDVEPHFGFPSVDQVESLIKPRDQHDFYTNYHGPGSSASFGPKTQHQHDPAFKIPMMGEHWTVAAERIKEEEAAKEKAAKEAQEKAAAGGAGAEGQEEVPSGGKDGEQKDGSKKKKTSSSSGGGSGKSKKSKQKSLTASLSLMGIEDSKAKRALLDVDKALGGDKTFHHPNAQTLSQRLLACLVELPPGAPARGPWMPHPSGKDKKPATAAPNVHRKKASEYSLDKRIEMELKYIGLLGGVSEFSHSRELLDRSDDELSAALRQVQRELSSVLEQANPLKLKLYPTLIKVTDHGEKLTRLLEVEAQLIKVYQARDKLLGGGGGKKSLASMHSSSHATQQAYEATVERVLNLWDATLRSVGSRRSITGWIPDPVDLGGIPRTKLHLYPPYRGYLDVLERGVEVEEVPDPVTGEMVRGPPWKHVIPPNHPHNADYHEVVEKKKGSDRANGKRAEAQQQQQAYQTPPPVATAHYHASPSHLSAPPPSSSYSNYPSSVASASPLPAAAVAYPAASPYKGHTGPMSPPPSMQPPLHSRKPSYGYAAANATQSPGGGYNNTSPNAPAAGANYHSGQHPAQPVQQQQYTHAQQPHQTQTAHKYPPPASAMQPAYPTYSNGSMAPPAPTSAPAPAPPSKANPSYGNYPASNPSYPPAGSYPQQTYGGGSSHPTTPNQAYRGQNMQAHSQAPPPASSRQYMAPPQPAYAPAPSSHSYPLMQDSFGNPLSTPTSAAPVARGAHASMNPMGGGLSIGHLPPQQDMGIGVLPPTQDMFGMEHI